MSIQSACLYACVWLVACATGATKNPGADGWVLYLMNGDKQQYKNTLQFEKNRGIVYLLLKPRVRICFALHVL